jgi:hypothetical protein
VKVDPPPGEEEDHHRPSPPTKKSEPHPPPPHAASSPRRHSAAVDKGGSKEKATTTTTSSSQSKKQQQQQGKTRRTSAAPSTTSSTGAPSSSSRQQQQQQKQRKLSRKKKKSVVKGDVAPADPNQRLEFPATPELILAIHKRKPFLDKNEEWLIVELNEYECLVETLDIIKTIANHSKFFEVEPDELWEEFFEYVEEMPSYDEVINYDVWQEFRDERYPC